MFETVSEAVEFDIGYGALAAPIVTSIRGLMGKKDTPVLVGVCGRSRAGKSVVAHSIVRILTEEGVACLLVRLDDWIVPIADRRPNSSAEARNRVDTMPELVHALRGGATVRAPGYDVATRGSGESVTYDSGGRSVVVIEGNFAGHRSVQSDLDFAVFAAVPEGLQRSRFSAFYRWKGLDDNAIEALWQERAVDEWPAVDEQRSSADFVIAQGHCHS
jgi:uridine kinase